MTEDLRSLLEETPAPKKTLSFTAIISFITGILTYLLLFFHSFVDMSFVVAIILAPISALVAIFTGHRAKKKIRHAEGIVRGKKMANIGLFLGYLFIIVGILIAVLAIIGLSGLISTILHLFGG